MNEWRPIESAPKEGRILLGRFTGDPKANEEGRVRVGRWRPAYRGYGEFNMLQWPPTHWMPLPDPPQ